MEIEIVYHHVMGNIFISIRNWYTDRYQKEAKANSYANARLIFACCNMWSKLNHLIASSVVWIFLLEFSNSDSITNADGYPYRLAEAWSEQAYPHLVST